VGLWMLATALRRVSVESMINHLTRQPLALMERRIEVLSPPGIGRAGLSVALRYRASSIESATQNSLDRPLQMSNICRYGSVRRCIRIVQCRNALIHR
jgi:hypothetical protein